MPAKPKLTDEGVLMKIRQMLKTLDTMFTESGITYWMDGGTLLGAVRHQDIIPWDDDGDLSVLKKDDSKLKKLEVKLNRNGYGMVSVWLGYKIFPLDGALIRKDFKYKFPFIDIFLVEENKNVYHYSDIRVKNSWKKYYHEKKDLLPLKRYQFNDFTLVGPNNPVPYLDRAYGSDWRTKGWKSYDHSREIGIPKRIYKI